jgi:Family of unknown function (DUF6266)
MGTIKKGILGGFSGRVGPAVGSSWKGIDVIRSRPPRKRRRSTEGQLSQMERMKLVSEFVAPLTGLLNKTYGGGLVNMSAFNKALSYNMRNAVDGNHPEFRINFARVVLGTGDLLNPELSASVSEATGQIRFIWKDNSLEGSARSTDQAFAAIYCRENDAWQSRSAGAQRNAGSYTLDITAFSGKAVHAYIGFLSAGGKFVSTSQYAGLVNIL